MNKKDTYIKVGSLFIGTFLILYAMMSRKDYLIGIGSLFLIVYEFFEYKFTKAKKHVRWMVILIIFALYMLISEIIKLK